MELHLARLGAAGLIAGLLAGCEFGVEQAPSAQAPAASAPAGGRRLAQGGIPFTSDYLLASQAALRAERPLMLFFTAEWCQFCHQMADEAFTNPQVLSLSSRFVCVVIDADAEPGLCAQFRVTSFPTVQFVSPRGVPLQRVVGKQPGHQLMMAMQSALQSMARRSNGSEATLLR